MAYRDEREALRARNEELELALEDAHSEVERLRSSRTSLSLPEQQDSGPLEARIPGARLPFGKIAAALAALLLSMVVIGAPLAFLVGPAPLLAFVVLLALLQRSLHVARPYELLIVSGRRDPRTGRGFRIFGGRRLAVPFVEQVHRIDLRVFRVEVVVPHAETTAAPVSIEIAALAKISSDDRLVTNAVERFLERPQEHIADIAAAALDGHVHDVVAALTPAEVSSDRATVAASIAARAQPDLAVLGIELKALRILRVDDAEMLPDRHPRIHASGPLYDVSGGERQP